MDPMLRLRAALTALIAIAAFGAGADVEAKGTTAAKAKTNVAEAKTAAKRLGANAVVAFNRMGTLIELSAALASPKYKQPLTPEEDAAAQIHKLLRSTSLRRGVTGMFVADARTGVPLFAVNADDALNPASNVKLISTATALELLGPRFRYPTRVLGATPIGGVVHGDVFLLGSYDPTLTAKDFEGIAEALVARGITSIEGSIVVGSDPTRDGIFRSLIPITITAGEVGEAPTALGPVHHDLVTIRVTATTTKKQRSRLTYDAKVVPMAGGVPRVELTIGGTLTRGKTASYSLWTKQRTANAAFSLMASLRARAIPVTGEVKQGALGDFVGDSILTGKLPVELARHDSLPLAEIVAKVNKRSINWLADRVVMTGAALARRQPPSMKLALDEMYAWLARRPQLGRDNLVIDTGSGLSYQTRITPHALVSIVRSAGGFTGAASPLPELAAAWKRSLAVGATDGTLRHRFRGAELKGHIRGKTGTLRTVIAVSGILDIDPDRPLVFALVTNAEKGLDKKQVRRAHELLLGEVCRYLARTRGVAAPAITAPSAPPEAPLAPDEIEETDPDTSDGDADASLSSL